MPDPLRILLVEDSSRDAELLVHQLEAAGFELDWRRVESESDYLEQLDATLDAILCDSSLPQFDPLQALHLLNERGLDIPLIVVSGSISEEAAVDCLKQGAADYLLKDRLTRLAPALRQALEQQRLRAEARRADQALHESEARYRRMVETAQEGIWEIDAEHRTTFANLKMAEMLGTTVEAMLGVSIFAFMDDEGRTIAVAGMDRRIRGIGDHYEVKYVRADGTELWAIVAANSIHDAAGRYTGALALVTDITDRKAAEAERERLLASEQAAHAELLATQQRVVQQERLRAMGEMSSGIAHDFNNALAIVLGHSDLLLADSSMLEDAERARQSVFAINIAAQDAAAVVGRLREFYRERDVTEPFVSVDIAAVVGQTIEMTRPKWKDDAQGKGATVTVQTALESAPPILGSPSDLREALVNLIINAVDAMPAGGVLTISTRVDGELVVLEVADTGLGMSEEVRRRCLEPFYTTKGEQGTGLGLPAVYGMVSRHQGTIEIASEVGAGTRITLRFVAAREEALVNPPSIHAHSPRGSLRILLVDDHPSIRAMLSMTLRSDGHTVEDATDGPDALRKFTAGRFDLVITDQSMPGMSGSELAVQLKRHAANTPIILLTGFGDIMNAEGQQPEDIDLVVGKPVTLRQLREAISSV